jgi:hypothetical protein
MKAGTYSMGLKSRSAIRVCSMAVIALCAGFIGCRSPGNHISKQTLIKGVERALSEPETLTYGTLVRHGKDLVVKAYCSDRRDGSGDMKVFDKDDRLIYELVTRCDEAKQSMHLTERNHVNGESLDYDVPFEQYYDVSYDPTMFATDPNFWACMVGDDWRSWLSVRNDFQTYLADEIRMGRLSQAQRGKEKLILVREPNYGAPHEFYFDPQDDLLRLWRTTVDVEGKPLTRDRVYVYCDGLSETQCMSALGPAFSRLVSSEGEVR